MIIPVLLPWIFRSITYHALRETQGLTLLEFLWILSRGLQTCSVNYMYLVHQLVTTMGYLQTAHIVMTIRAAMIRTLNFFSFVPIHLPPFSLFQCLLFRVLVPYGCDHNPFWRLYCSRWLIPRISVLGGCVLTTISITSVSVVVLQTCIRFYLANNHSLTCEPSFPASSYTWL